ncbi:MAG: CRISPR-associated helicase Cas3' [Deltaproteobacteria bacterium]|nr:CRISPR-associated helicase Cas3' [Deltaproteobacteria bacterium]
MKPPITREWGKFDRESGDWHPLLDHCADVAAVAEALMSTVLLPRLEHLAGRALSQVDLARLLVLVALHDFGKTNAGFQNKALGRTPRAGHVAEWLSLLNGAQGRLGKLLQPILEWSDGLDEASLEILLASVCHHGRPVSLDSRDTPGFSKSLWPDTAWAGMQGLIEAARRWFPEAFEEAPPLPTSPWFQHAFSGLVTLADWIGSNRAFFPFSEAGDGDRMTFARQRAREVVAHLGLDARPARQGLSDLGVQFERVFGGRTPRAAQHVMAQLPLPRPGDASVVVLEAETGAGKTEAALIYALRLFEAGQVDGLTFALPTRTAATQVHARVVLAIERAFPPESRPQVILAVPGYLDEGTVGPPRLPEQDVLWNDDPFFAQRFRSWASESSKRYLAGPIVVGTIDQVLLSALEVGHAQLRATALLRHLVIIDEVHASDDYMTAVTCRVLDFHRRAGGHALLMSATLGSDAASRLLEQRPGLKFEDAQQLQYPLITSVTDSQGLVRHLVAVESTRAKGIEVSTRPWLEEDAAGQLVSHAVDAARGGAKVLILRNTVRSAIATMDHLERAAPELVFRCAGRPALHHSRFAREDRVALDKAIEAILGEERPDGGCVVIATQTVQQALDLDADLMLTDLAPMDVLLQRFGRLHRHARSSRPSGFEVPRAIVMVPEQPLTALLSDNGERVQALNGVGNVYADLRVLEATRRLVERHGVLQIPSMNRALVEATTHPSVLDALAVELGESMVRHGRVRVGEALADRRHASRVGYDRSLTFGNARFVSDDRRHPTTRLGDGDRRIEFPPTDGAFGTTISSFNVPWFLARGWGEEPPTPTVVPRRGGFDLVIGDQRLTYDHRGLRPADVSPTEGDDDVGA